MKRLLNTANLPSKVRVTKGGPYQGLGQNHAVRYVGGRATRKGR